MTKQSRPPVDPDAARELVEPSVRDRERIRENIDRALARGSASQTVLRVDASMAQRALGAAPGAAIHGSKLALAKLVIPAVLIGAGLGAIWARSLHAPANPEAPSHSLPVQVEELDDDALGAGGVNIGEAPPGEAAVFERTPPTAAAKPVKSQPIQNVHRSHPHSNGARAASHAPAAAFEPAPSVAEAESPAAPEVPSHHLAEELRLMRAASAALGSDDIPRTLNLLSQHAERFPDGALREERRALRVISLCKQGRSHFALVERDEFLSSSPRSPLTARVREACELPK